MSLISTVIGWFRHTGKPRPVELPSRRHEYEIAASMEKLHPNNCPVIEKTADGVRVGVCWFALKDGICPRHGRVK